MADVRGIGFSGLYTTAVFHHGYAPGDGDPVWIPWVRHVEIKEGDFMNYSCVFLAPSAGYLDKVTIASSLDLGAACGIELFSGTNQQMAGKTSLGTEKTVDLSTANQEVTVSFGRAYRFSQYDNLGIVVSPSGPNPAGAGVLLTTAWKLRRR